ncbi:hypothetical protein [Streptomyces sp. NPDC049555]|uniref:hypothetical protein n=1 Tax=Streptomyces sp. NPDC049555 TaxID=3154930 RepID=UPI003430C79E
MSQPPQPGPYGVPPQQPPQQPNPYAQQPPIPQQPPQAPQAPYAQQPNPYENAGGYPPAYPSPYPPPVPEQRSGKGRTIGIAIGAVILVGAIVGGAYALMGGKNDGGEEDAKAAARSSASASPSPSASASSLAPGDDGKRYKLVTPDTVLGGAYKKDPSGSGGGFASVDQKSLLLLGVKDAQNVTAGYVTEGTAAERKGMKFTGLYGQVKDPEATVDSMFLSVSMASSKEKSDGTKTTLDGDPQKMTPAGLEAGAVMKCQKTVYSGGELGSRTFKMPLCIWADHSTVGTVFVADASSLVPGGAEVTLQDASERTAKLRKETRVEVTKQ